MIPLVLAGSPSHLFQRKSFTLPSLVIQCSAPARRCGDGGVVTSFISGLLAGRGSLGLMSFALRLTWPDVVRLAAHLAGCCSPCGSLPDVVRLAAHCRMLFALRLTWP